LGVLEGKGLPSSFVAGLVRYGLRILGGGEW